MSAIPLRRPVFRYLLVSLLLALGALAALVYAKYRHDLGKAFARVATGSEVARTACGEIEYAAIGEGPAVLLVHGAGGGFDQTLPAARELAARGLRVVVPSRFGYLRTPQRADATPAAQADAHACLLDALHIRRAAVIGVSAGAPSSLQFALRHGDRCTALVLLVPLAYAPEPHAALVPPGASARWMFEQAIQSDFLYWLVASVHPGLVQRTILGTPSDVVRDADTAEKARVDWLMWQLLPLSVRLQGLLNDAAVATHLQRYELERITAPTLVASTADDGYGTFAAALYAAQHVPGARFLALRDGGHLWVGHHREVMGEIAAFIVAAAR